MRGVGGREREGGRVGEMQAQGEIEANKTFHPSGRKKGGEKEGEKGGSSLTLLIQFLPDPNLLPARLKGGKGEEGGREGGRGHFDSRNPVPT